ncbi:hypothetical protein PF010_g27290 [Phytophthora fragariae]|uniref:Uncharacterized protein n=1 Tax=Phytophthora fragariae TaxID=53985 RepID=A0A6G0JV69_9STRA|nr:hypothetical protein PF010_g27290 [Phytophthora fragariae]
MALTCLALMWSAGTVTELLENYTRHERDRDEIPSPEQWSVHGFSSFAAKVNAGGRGLLRAIMQLACAAVERGFAALRRGRLLQHGAHFARALAPFPPLIALAPLIDLNRNMGAASRRFDALRQAKKKTTSKKLTAEQASATKQAPPKKCADASSAAIAPTAPRVGSTKVSASGKKPFTAATATSTAAPETIASALDTTQRKGDVCRAEVTTGDGHAVTDDARTDEEHQVLQSFAHVHAERQHSGQQAP